MKTTTRYSLIIFGFIVFLIIAPMLVLYVSGRKLNINDRDTSATGILDAKSNPGGATLQINDKDENSTPSIARFLVQGQYKITLKKDGYYDWVKNLAIEPGKVTYTQSGVDEIQLIKQSSPVTLVESGVTSFTLVDDTVWYSAQNAILKGSLTDPIPQTILPINFTPTGITRLRDKTHLLASDTKNNYIVVNTNNNKVIPLPNKFGALEDVTVISDDLILIRSGKSLLAYKPTDNTTSTLRNDLIAFTVLDSTGYFATTAGVISSAVWNGSAFVDEQNIIQSTAAVSSTKGQLIISNKKVLFYINGNNDLFRVGNTLELILNRVVSAELDLGTDELSVRTPSELWFYNFISNETQLLTRSTTTTNDYMIHSAIGYGFVANTEGVEAIEIDNRDTQNRYQILRQKVLQPMAVWQIAMSVNQKSILLLQEGSLITIEIRN